jgi:predicted nucleic acid-binding protein
LRWALLDTDVYIEHLEGRMPLEALRFVQDRFIVRQSSVVLSELRRGARTAAARRWVERLRKAAAVRWEPTDADWWEAGKLVQQLGDRAEWDAAKRRDFQNDTLIALTARRHGATVVTRNRSDFELLRSAAAMDVLIL